MTTAGDTSCTFIIYSEIIAIYRSRRSRRSRKFWFINIHNAKSVLFKVSFVIFLLGFVPVLHGQPNAAGMSQVIQADNNVRLVANQVVTSLQTALGGILQQFVPVSYRVQAVPGGVNYFLKAVIQTSSVPGQYVHIRILNSNGQSSLMGMEMNRKVEDPISYMFIRICPTTG